MFSKIFKRPELAGFLALMACGVAIWLGAFVFYKEPATGSAAPPIAAKTPEKPAQRALTGTGLPPLSPPPAAAQADADDDKISAIISNTNLDFPAAVDQLLGLLPTLGESAQDEAAHHIANLSDDDQSKKWVALVVASKIPAAAAEVLFNDMLNRPHEILLPALATMADAPQHPKQKDSAETLEILYGDPPQGTTWDAWIKAKVAEEAK